MPQKFAKTPERHRQGVVFFEKPSANITTSQICLEKAKQDV